MPNTTENPTTEASSEIVQDTTFTFAPMYYDSPVTKTVLTFDIGVTAVNAKLTAAITAGAPYFKVSALAKTLLPPSGNPVPLPPHSPGKDPEIATSGLPGPVAISDGVTPLFTLGGESVQLLITAEVPEGAALAPGSQFTGTAVVTGEGPGGALGPWTVALEGTYLGPLIGTVSVEPATVAPGESVQIQVLTALGQPLSDPSVSVSIQGVPGASRWEQYATEGTRNLYVIASNGSATQTAQASVAVSGTPLQFTIDPPSTQQLAIIQAATVPGLPYAGSFTLGTPRTASDVPVSASPIKVTAAAPASPTAAAPPAAEPAAGAAAGAAAAGGAALRGGNAAGALAAGSAEIPAAAVATSYTWDFGDGSPTVTTQSPTVTHDFFAAISGDAVEHFFDVSCRAAYDNVTVRRTIVLHSAYGMCKQLGTVVPPITGAPTYAPLATGSLIGSTLPLDGFSASMIVHNLEPGPIVLDSLAIVPLSDATSVNPPAPQFVEMSTPQTIAAGSASALGAFVPFSALSLGGPPANAFALYYSGSIAVGVPVRFSVVFRISGTYSGLTTSKASSPSPAWELGPALQALTKLTGTRGGLSAGGESVDAATRTITVPLAADAHTADTVIQATSTVQAGLASITSGALAKIATAAPPAKAPAAAQGTAAPAAATAAAADTAPASATPAAGGVAGAAAAAPAFRDEITINPTDPPPVAPGATCYPDDISDADAASAAAQQLVCQLSPGASPQTVTVPAAFQNAQAGDVILSPAPTGDGDLIAAMFAALTPPQHHGHSGIMTANFYEITHCTASVARIAANVNKDKVGIPTSLNEQMLQYGWPGSLTQTIDEATNSVPWTAPEGTTYTESSFNYDDRGNPQQLIPPMVVKPLPENEQMARPLLRQAADLARSKGAQYASQFNQPAGKTAGEQLSIGGCYYSFYNYTQAQISAGFTDPAPAAGGWAQGMSPAVCSAFVWMCMKATGIPCVSTNADESLAVFSAAALNTGEVAVSPDASDPTLDGLIYYPEQERQAGANALYNLFMEQALSQEGGFGSIPGVNGAIAGPLADQLLNCFAFGDPTMVGQTSWQNPGVGNAVSPDNIMLWSPPYFGYAEALQYLPSHTDQYTPSEWVRVTTHGTISGKVTRGDTGAPVAGALVWANLNVTGMYAITATDGTYTLTHVPLGTYALQATADIPIGSINVEFTNDQGVDYTLTAANDGNGTQDLVINQVADTFRQINVSYQISCDHGDDNPFPGDPHGVQTAGPYSRSMFLNPGQQTTSFSYTFDYNGGGYFHCTYTFTATLISDTNVQVDVQGVMYDDGNPASVQAAQPLSPPAVLPPGGSASYYIDMENTGLGYHDGPANFTFTMDNIQQTG